MNTTSNPPAKRRAFPGSSSEAEDTFVGGLLRQETVGGAVVLLAATVAVVWANTPLVHEYESLRHLHLGPLTVEEWAADGALTLFFYLAGLELKRELVVGSLRRPSDALVPVAAAVAGVATPALIYVALNAGPLGSVLPGGRPEGWAIPAATDIAFALAVLAVVGSGLPSQLRAFLLTLAVVDDLVVIVIIAAFYTATLHLEWVAVALGLLGLFAFGQHLRGEHWAWYIPLSIATWWAVHESGIHATIAGVAMGLLTRVRLDPGENKSPAEVLEHVLTPWSAGVAVPFFALMSAGVAVSGGLSLFSDPVFLGVVVGLVIGKPVGVLAGAWLATRVTRAELSPELSWRDVAGVAVLAGVGFTVALLVAELSFGGQESDNAKAAILFGSLTAALLAAVLLRRRSRVRAES